MLTNTHTRGVHAYTAQDLTHASYPYVAERGRENDRGEREREERGERMTENIDGGVRVCVYSL